MSDTDTLMSRAEYHDCLAALRWTPQGVGEVLEVNPTTARRWARGEVPIPPRVADWLRTLAAVHKATPVPTEWRARRDDG